jgi:hypothetical protein
MVPSAGQTGIKNNMKYYFLKVSPLLGLVMTNTMLFTIFYVFFFHLE